MVLKKIFHTISVLLPLLSFSQSRIQFHQTGINDGLTDLTVNAIAQDSLGIMYFGTENGLSIYDGNSFESYFANGDSNTISNNLINALLVDRRNRVWIGTSTGLDIYDRKTVQFRSYSIHNTEFTISSLFEDNQGRIWINTWGAGLCFYNEETDSITPLENDLINNISISCITEDLRGNLWLGSEDKGLFFVDGTTLEVSSFTNGIEGIAYPINLSNTRIRALCPDNSGNMYIGTYDEGMYYYNAQEKIIRPFNTKEKLLNINSRISGILKGHDNNFWISTDGDGLFQYNKATHTVRDVNESFNFNNPIASKAIRTIFFDNNHTLWLGTYKAGINYTYEIQQKRFGHYQSAFEKKSVTAFNMLDENNILIGTDGDGLYNFNIQHRKLNKIKIPDHSPLENVLSIHRDYLNNLFVGTFIGGIYQFNTKMELKATISSKNNNLSYNDVRAIVSDSNNLYFATNFAGLDVFERNTGTITNYLNNFDEPDSGIIYNELYEAFIDSRNFLWLGSINGITRMDLNTREFVNIYSTDSVHAKINIHSIYEDSYGFIWIGTNHGLSKLKSSVWSKKLTEAPFDGNNYSFSNYFSNENELVMVYSLLEDDSGNLWLGTNSGLIRFNIKEEKAHFFYSETGVNMKLFNPRSAFKTEDKFMYFGGNNGFIRFFPDSITDLNITPNLIISNFYINMKEVKKGDKVKDDIILQKHINYTNNIRLKPGVKIVSIGYTSTNSFLPHEIEYAYMLEGFDTEWIIAQRNFNHATYTNLPPGNYTFKLKARYSNTDWNRNIKILNITIRPPFWKTWFFRISIFLVITGTIYFLYARNVKRLREENEFAKRFKTHNILKILKDKEMKLIEYANSKRLLLEKNEIDREKLRLEREMRDLQTDKFNSELNQKNELEIKLKAEISASLAQISKMNDLLITIKNELNILEPAKTEVSEGLKKVVKKINSESFFQDDWHKFETHFNSVYADFIQKLKSQFPELTRKELRLCSYLKMNLSSNEIAQLSNITVRGVEKSRSRLRKKIGLSPTDDLNAFILNI